MNFFLVPFVNFISHSTILWMHFKKKLTSHSSLYQDMNKYIIRIMNKTLLIQTQSEIDFICKWKI